jgi:hypothetical protein
VTDRHELGLDDDEHVFAEVTVQYPRHFDRELDPRIAARTSADLGAPDLGGTLFGHRQLRMPKSGIGRYRAWQQHADEVGFPVGGMAMRLGVTERRLIVWTATFVLSHAKHFAGDVPLRRVVQASVSRSMGGGRLHLVLDGSALVTLDTMTPAKARRFAHELLAARDRLRA